MRIGLKLTITFIVVSFASMFLVAYISYYQAKRALRTEAFNKLIAIREMKGRQIEDYFHLIDDQVMTYAHSPSIIYSAQKFIEGFNTIDRELNVSDEEFDNMNDQLNSYYNDVFIPKLEENLKKKVDIRYESANTKNGRILQYLYIANNTFPAGEKDQLDFADTITSYGKIHKRFHPANREFLEKFGYYDIFIVDANSGNIVYSVFKEVDFGTSLIDGPYAKTNLARVFTKTNNSKERKITYMVDFENYHPSYNEPAAFIASPIYKDDEKIGVMIFQLPIKSINEIMTHHHRWADIGLGNSGETYIVGDDYTLRNQSRFLVEDSANYFKMIRDIGIAESTLHQIRTYNSSISLQHVKTKGTIAALNGQQGAEIFPDYRGVPVLSAYRPLNIPDVNWVIMSEIDEDEAFENIFSLKHKIFIAFIILFIVIIVVSLIISRQITKPVKELSTDAMELSRGNFDVVISLKNRKDEIGILSTSFKKMQQSIKKLIGELKDINQHLEQKVEDRTKEINRQKEMVEEKNKEIVDSINYAKRLQQAILPPMELIRKNLHDSFLIFEPKDIVSGDFYWMTEIDDVLLVAVADCTGHGVPGAMVSVVGANGLNRCVKEFGLKKPAAILDKLTDLVVETFELTDHEVKDGMDIAMCAINRKTHTIEFSGANNPLWKISKATGELEEIKADKQPIGKFDYRQPFTNHELTYESGDCFYFFSDGYADQFGGPGGKKFKYKTLKELLWNHRDQSMQEQGKVLIKTFQDWKGHLEQIDDVCVIGFRL